MAGTLTLLSRRRKAAPCGFSADRPAHPSSAHAKGKAALQGEERIDTGIRKGRDPSPPFFLCPHGPPQFGGMRPWIPVALFMAWPDHVLCHLAVDPVPLSELKFLLHQPVLS